MCILKDMLLFKSFGRISYRGLDASPLRLKIQARNKSISIHCIFKYIHSFSRTSLNLKTTVVYAKLEREGVWREGRGSKYLTTAAHYTPCFRRREWVRVCLPLPSPAATFTLPWVHGLAFHMPACRLHGKKGARKLFLKKSPSFLLGNPNFFGLAESCTTTNLPQHGETEASVCARERQCLNTRDDQKGQG